MSKNKFWNEHRKSHYSWLLAIFVSLMAAYNVGIATVIPAMVLWAPCTFMILVVADTVPSQDLLKRALTIFFLPTVILYWFFLVFVFNIKDVIYMIKELVKSLLALD